MFYKEDDVLLLLNCPRCKIRYTDARILPCSETICVNCIETLKVNEEFSCPFCEKKHNGDFVQNKLVMSMLKIRSDNVIRDPLVEELKQKTTQLESLMEQLEKSIKSPEIEVCEHCSLIRNQIDLAAEKRKFQIDEIRSKFLTQVDDYEKQCVQNIKEHKIDSHYQEFEKSLKMHIDDCREMLKNFRIDEEQVKKETEVTTSKIKEIEEFLIELKHVQFKGEVLKFTEQTFTFTEQDDRILGCINRNKITENSNQFKRLVSEQVTSKKQMDGKSNFEPSQSQVYLQYPPQAPILAFAQPGAPPAGPLDMSSNQQATGSTATLAALTQSQLAAVTAAQRQPLVDPYMQQQQQQQSHRPPNPMHHPNYSKPSFNSAQQQPVQPTTGGVKPSQSLFNLHYPLQVQQPEKRERKPILIVDPNTKQALNFNTINAASSSTSSATTPISAAPATATSQPQPLNKQRRRRPQHNRK